MKYIKSLLLAIAMVSISVAAQAACTSIISISSTVTSPVTITPATSGCTGWPGTSGFVRVEQTQPFPTHFDGRAGSSSATVTFSPGTYSVYVTLWTNSVTQIGTASNTVTFTVSTATPAPTPSPTPSPTASPTPVSGCVIAPDGLGNLVANCPIVAPAFIVQSSSTPIPTSTSTPVPTASPTSTPVPVAGVMRANDFLNTLGVTSHWVQGLDTTAQWQTAFTFLGVRHGRDDFTCDTCDSRQPMTNFFCPMHAATGVTWVGMPNAGDLGNTKTSFDELAACGSLLSMEGANEPNNQHFTYNGQPCDWSPGGNGAGCGPWQRDLNAMVKADSTLVGFPMFSVTEDGAMTSNDGEQFLTIPAGTGATMPAGTAYADFANLHNYVKGNNATLADNKAWDAEDPNFSLQSVDGMDGEFINQTWRMHFPASPVGTNIPRVTTETGWDTPAISQDMQGKVLTSVYLDAAARGWSYTFIYQLIDDRDSFGLFANASPPTPKLAANYIHNLTTILADNSSAFTPTIPSYTITTSSPNVHSLLMQKSNGLHELTIWCENFASQTSVPVTVNLATAANVKVYDITMGTTPTQTLTNVNSVPLTLMDHAVILEF